MKNKYATIVSVLLILVMFSSAEYAKDEYKVIKVIGEIVYKGSGNHMNTGDVFTTETSIQFITNNSRAAVISRLRGRFVLAPPSAEKKTNLVPAVNSMSSRSGAIVNELDFKKHFEGDYLIIGKVEIPVSPQNFPQNANKFFFLSYEYEGEKIMKQLSTSEGKVILNQNVVFTIDGKQITPFNTQITLYYRDQKEKKNTSLASFKAVFPKEDLLRKEVNVILMEYEDAGSEQQYQQVRGYLNEFYGKPYDPNLKEWLANNS